MNTAYFATQMLLKYSQFGALVVAQLVEQSPLTPEIRGSIPFIGKLLSNIVSCQLCWKEENNEKRGREWPILKYSQLDAPSEFAHQQIYTINMKSS